MPNNDDLGFTFTPEVSYFADDNNKLILANDDDYPLIYDIKMRTVYRYQSSQQKSLQLNIGLEKLLYSIFYYQQLIFNLAHDQANRSQYKQQFCQIMQHINPPEQNIDYYWGSLIEEIETGAVFC